MYSLRWGCLPIIHDSSKSVNGTTIFVHDSPDTVQWTTISVQDSSEIIPAAQSTGVAGRFVITDSLKP
jgi:hypothetical protein